MAANLLFPRTLLEPREEQVGTVLRAGLGKLKRACTDFKITRARYRLAESYVAAAFLGAGSTHLRLLVRVS